MHDEQEFSVLDRCYIVVAGLSSDHFYMVHGILSYFARNLLLLELGWFSIFVALCHTVEKEVGVGLVQNKDYSEYLKLY